MKILPVLDVMHGQVVRGVGGRRHEYRPLVCPLATTPEPLAVARGFREHFGLDEIYVADLDAIAGQPPAISLFRALQEGGFRLWVDAGIRTVEEALARGYHVVSSTEELSYPAFRAAAAAARLHRAALRAKRCIVGTGINPVGGGARGTRTTCANHQ